MHRGSKNTKREGISLPASTYAVSASQHTGSSSGHPSVSGLSSQYSSTETPAEQAKHELERRKKMSVSQSVCIEHGKSLEGKGREVKGREGINLPSGTYAVIAKQHTGSSSGHPTVLGFSLQNSSSDTPSTHDKHCAVKALQQGLCEHKESVSNDKRKKKESMTHRLFWASPISRIFLAVLFL